MALPLSLALDPDNANGLCEFVDGSKAEPTCPKASIVGTATAKTPLLAQPLTGPVYFVKNIRKDAKTGREIRTLPKLVIPLTGQNGLQAHPHRHQQRRERPARHDVRQHPRRPGEQLQAGHHRWQGRHPDRLGHRHLQGHPGRRSADRRPERKGRGRGCLSPDPGLPAEDPSKKIGKSSVAVKVGGLGAGKVTVTGHGIKKTNKTITKSTVATITAKRSKGTPGKVTVSFDPTGPAKAHKTTK